MDSTVISAIITGGITLAVCVINNYYVIRRTEKSHQDNIVLIDYRLKQLEKKVDKHNNLIERTYDLERRADVMEEKIKVGNNRISDLERHEHDDGR